MATGGAPRSAAIRVAMLDALAAEIREVGIDQAGCHTTADRAGLTTGAIYSRWSSLEEFKVDCWSDRVAPRLRWLYDAALEASAAPEGQQARKLEAILEARTRDLVDDILPDFLLASRRHPALNEVMLAQVSGWLDESRPGQPAREARIAILGALAGQSILGRLSRERSFSWAQLFADVAAAGKSRKKFCVLTVPQSPLKAVEHPAEDRSRLRLLEAAAAVIARSGMHGATVARIGRLAKVDGTVLYRRYSSMSELLVASLRAHMAVRTDADVRLMAEHFPREESAGEFVAAVSISALASPGRKEWRELQYESHLAARFEPSIARLLQETIDGRITASAAFLADAARLGPPGKVRSSAKHPTRDTPRFYQALTVGTGVMLNSVGLEVDLPALQRVFAFVFDAMRTRVLSAGAVASTAGASTKG